MKRIATWSLATLVSLILLIAWAAGQDESPSIPSSEGIATVVFVVDGDTVDLRIHDQTERVRLIGVDTPETVSRSTPIQCFGPEASAALVGLLPPGTEVRIERDTEARDRYGRLLLYLYRISDDLFVNQWLITSGFAEAVSYPPNETFAASFTMLRDEARSNNRGLWGACEGPDQPLQ